MTQSEIAEYFAFVDDGEFCPQDRFNGMTVDGNLEAASTIVYVSKPPCVSRLRPPSNAANPLVTVANYGIPTKRDLSMLSDVNAKMYFIGDADPPDLLLFAYLRNLLPISWFGVSDGFLNTYETRHLAWITCRQSDTELASHGMVEQFCSDYKELIGEYCATIFAAGHKIEIEGATVAR